MVNTPKNDDSMRLAKFISHAGVCSRREAEKLIEQGEVAVNGEVIMSPATNVTAADKITVNGREIGVEKQGKPRLFMMNKPRGVLCTTKDPQGRPTVFSLLPQGLPRLVSVGRLDLNSEGLLLFTDSPTLAEQLMHPRNEIERTYRVRISGNFRPEQIAELKSGITVEGVRYQGVKVAPEGEKTGRNSWNIMTLTEGKNREIRKLMAYFHLEVSRLVRLSYGPFELGKLPKSAMVEVPYKEIEKFIKNLK